MLPRRRVVVTGPPEIGRLLRSLAMQAVAAWRRNEDFEGSLGRSGENGKSKGEEKEEEKKSKRRGALSLQEAKMKR